MDAGSAPLRYSAFISYNHRDARFADALQQRLESYRLPRRFTTADRSDGRRLKPVFRDRAELVATPDLSAAVRTALAEAGHLIVVCTPNSARSEWVGREVTLFRALHGDAGILAALFDGDSAAAFHPALVSQADDGSTIRPLAADFRPEGDGQRLALLKLVAPLAGLPLDALVQRDAQRRLRQLVVATAATVLILALVAVLATFALFARGQARAEQARGVATVAQLVSQREQFKRVGRLDLLETQDRTALDFFRGQDIASLPPDAQLLSAKLLQGIAEDDETGGDLAGMKEAAASAWRTTQPLLAANPDDTTRIFAHAQSAYWVGKAAWRLDDLAAAERHLTDYSALSNRLVAIAPGRADWQRESGDAASSLGTLILRRSPDIDRAGRSFRLAQARFEAAARIDPNEPEVQTDLADGYAWLADIERLKGNYPAALAYRTKLRLMLEAMQRRDPDDAEIETALIKNQLGLARIAAAQERWQDAIAGFEQGRANALARARRDRTNADIARQARAFDLFEVRTWLDMPPALRPPPARIAAVLGDCAAERRRVHNEEAADFCTILEARGLVADGQSVHARQAVRQLKSLRMDSLTPRWRLFLKEEIRGVSL